MVIFQEGKIHCILIFCDHSGADNNQREVKPICSSSIPFDRKCILEKVLFLKKQNLKSYILNIDARSGFSKRLRRWSLMLQFLQKQRIKYRRPING